MTISIAMATFNGAAYLDAQLQSIRLQTRLPDELVVTDDHSDDATSEIVRRFAIDSAFEVRLEINSQRLGIRRNFDRALSDCHGDLVFLSDQDDVWLPGKIAEIVAIAEAHPERACFINNALLADKDLVSDGDTKLERIRAAGLPDEAMVMGCCTAFRRSLLAVLLPIPESESSHDNWLVQFADVLGMTMRLEIPLQYYRRHGANASDFHVNRLQVPGRVARFRNRISAIAVRATQSGGLEAECRFLANVVGRLSERHAQVGLLVGSERTDQLIESTRTRWMQLLKRCDVRRMPRLQRLSRVGKIWLEGGYGKPAGIASAIKDLFVVVDKTDGAPR